MRKRQVSLVQSVCSGLILSGVLLAPAIPMDSQTQSQTQVPATAPQVREVLPSYEGQTVVSVEIAGRPDLDQQELRPLLVQLEGQPFFHAKIDQSISALKSSGKVKEVVLEIRPQANGIRVLLICQPASYYGLFDFPGAVGRFPYSRLLQVSDYPPRGAYSPFDIQSAQASLVRFFQQNGYFEAKVDPEIQTDAAQGLVSVNFRVNLAEAASPDDMFRRLEDAGVMLRIDRSMTPTMAKTPTLAQWELDQLRTIERVVRLGHLQRVEPTRLVFGQGEVAIAKDAVIVHCAASGLQYRPLVPIWGEEAITLQPIRAGFPAFGAALAGYVEATIDGDEEKNRLCPPSPLPNTPADWARWQVLGGRAAMSFGSHPDIKAWADRVALNPARTPPELAGSDELTAAVERFRANVGAGMARMAEFAGMSQD